MDYTLLALTLGPGFALMLYIWLKDKYDKEPLLYIVISFLLGILSALPAIYLSGFFESIGLVRDGTPLGTAKFAWITVAFSEELAKFIMLFIHAYRKKHFDEPFDGIVYAVMISMGFATLENVIYVFSGDGSSSYRIALMRMFTAVPAHFTFAVLMGYFVGLAKFRNYAKIPFLFLGLFSAVLFHGAYDYFLFMSNTPFIYSGALSSLLLAILLSKKAIQMHQINSPFKNN